MSVETFYIISIVIHGIGIIAGIIVLLLPEENNYEYDKIDKNNEIITKTKSIKRG